ncbi:MAG TPA: DUF2911 domain-containing protein [Chitinophagales bacterium]|nr:DUF2911 domain-containing protein [Chitinophagales bacterium]
MKLSSTIKQQFLAIVFLFFILNAPAQTVTQPPSGDNNRCIVTQYIGALVSVTVTYNSPNVTGPNGEDRRGKIWGQLVPYGYVDQGFGTSKAAPWRAGSNENTTISFSHDVLVQGKPLKAGTYGFFIAPDEHGPWTLIFSKTNTAWGSFFYDEKNDALRITTTPKDAAFHEWLTYEFIDRETDSAVCALIWETKMIPFTIKVPDMKQVYISKMRQELENSAGFNWQGWNDAANYCMMNKTNLDEALAWTDKAIQFNENFTDLLTRAEVLAALGRTEEAKAALDKAVNSPTATAIQIHMYGRQLLAQGKKDDALRVWQLNAKNHPKTWPVNVGLARGYSAIGDYKTALKYAKQAYEEAPDEMNKNNMKNAIAKLEKSQDIN